MTSPDVPLYLHFLDRELGRSTNSAIAPETSERIIKCLLLATNSPLYCGLSLLWESPGINASLAQFCRVLIRSGVLNTVSHHSTPDEFLESRQILYSHDSARYPMYFRHAATSQRIPLGPTQYKDSSTTGKLSRGLMDWAFEGGRDPEETLPKEALDVAKTAVKSVLINRTSEAITYSLFSDSFSGTGGTTLSGIVQREISLLYTKHYMEFGAGDIPTGIGGFEFFDRLAINFPLFDAPLLSNLLWAAGNDELLTRSWESDGGFWESVGAWRGAIEHEGFRNKVGEILSSLRLSALKTLQLLSPGSLYAFRQVMLSTLRHAANGLPPIKSATVDWPYLIDRLNLLTAILQRDPSFEEAMEKLQEEGGNNSVDVLLVTATDVERDSLLNRFQAETGHKFNRRFGKRKTYYELGTLGTARILMVQTEMGSIGPGAAFGTVAGACDELDPSAVITMGIAFGVDPKKQKVGDILVSRQLHPYELQRVGTRAKDKSLTLTARGEVARASTRLLDRFRSATVDWNTCAVHFGLVLSGEKLIDNIDFRDQIRSMQPEAIGGEMEGAGTYAAAHERNKDWIVVKAICDWADGRKRIQKEKRQKKAADNAAAFVVHALRTGGFSTPSARK